MKSIYQQLSSEERGVIMAMTLRGSSARAIGLALMRSTSTITRERRRNGYRGGYSRVAVARNRYSVPCEWAGHMVSTRLYPNRVDVVAQDAGVASHARLYNRGQTNYDWQHYIDLVQRKPGALRNGTPFLDLSTGTWRDSTSRCRRWTRR